RPRDGQHDQRGPPPSAHPTPPSSHPGRQSPSRDLSSIQPPGDSPRLPTQQRGADPDDQNPRPRRRESDNAHQDDRDPEHHGKDPLPARLGLPVLQVVLTLEPGAGFGGGKLMPAIA